MKWKALATLSLTLGMALAACGAEPARALSFSVPWPYLEQTEYVLYDKDGKEIGQTTWTITKEGETYILGEKTRIGSLHDEKLVTVQATDLKPIKSTWQRRGTPADFSLEAEYKGDKLIVKARTKDGDKGVTIGVPADAYDNDEGLMMIRALPLSEGFSTAYTNVVPATASSLKLKLKVLAKETVEAPAGTFSTHKLQMDFGAGVQYAWYSVDEPYYLVKYQNVQSGVVFVLRRHS
ncbi:MAG: DUF3108 domain-containing protein [Chloroflexi bacterium]|nr:DUF3108 domain-containing protein [Chloroflexota bacterium]